MNDQSLFGSIFGMTMINWTILLWVQLKSKTKLIICSHVCHKIRLQQTAQGKFGCENLYSCFLFVLQQLIGIKLDFWSICSTDVGKFGKILRE